MTKVHQDGRTHFQNISIQSKDDDEDWRSFVHCTDVYGNRWELRGYGETAGEAADDGWKNYLDKDDWDIYGYVIEDN